MELLDWISAHPWTALFIWWFFVVGAAVIISAIRGN